MLVIGSKMNCATIFSWCFVIGFCLDFVLFFFNLCFGVLIFVLELYLNYGVFYLGVLSLMRIVDSECT